jgi:hypothetical protein
VLQRTSTAFSNFHEPSHLVETNITQAYYAEKQSSPQAQEYHSFTADAITPAKTRK